MGLTMRLLGAPVIDVDGVPLSVDTRKATALLSLLVVRDERLARDAVAALLWPDAAPERARASLRRTLSTLSAGLGGRWVATDRDQLLIRWDADVSCDVTELRRAARIFREHDRGHGADLATCSVCAGGLAAIDGTSTGGELLEGFVLRDAPGFGDWAQLESEALRRDASLVLERRTTIELATGRVEAALATAHRWSDSDPLHEGAHRAIMRAAAQLGRREEAVRQYRLCVATLDRELGVAPLAETTALHEAIVGDAPVPVAVRPRTVARAVPAVRRDAGALVDRDDELEELRTAHRELTAGATCVVVEGEAGIGKSRIIEEFVEFATGRGARATAIRCREDEVSLTCAPLSDGLRDAALVDPSWLGRLPRSVTGEVARIVPDLADAELQPATTALDSPGAQARFLDGIFAALAATVTGQGAGVLVLDDLHWADPTTIDVLLRGVHRYAGAPVLLVVAWRSELVPHDHPLRRLLALDGTRCLRPARLTRDQVAELVEDVRPRARGLVDRLHDETEGIPFFVLQYLTTVEDDSWDLPTPVRDLVASRLLPLSDLARQCVTAGAVLGRTFDLHTLVRTSGRSEDEVVTGIDELLDHRLLDERPGSRSGEARYDFTHSKLREVVLQRASLARRRLLHRRAAEALLVAGDDPAVAGRAALHLREAGEDTRAAEQHVIAGQHARSLYANVEALEHLTTALALGHPDVGPLRSAIGDLHALAGRYAEARDSYTAATATAEEPADLADLEHRLGVLHLRWGAWSTAERHLRSAMSLLGSLEPDEAAASARPRVRADLAVALLRGGDEDGAAREASAAVDEAAVGADGAALAQTHNTAGLVARRRGDHEVASRHLRRALEHAADLHDPAAHVAALNNLALVLAADGQVEEALATARDALDRCAAIGDRHRAAALHSNIADLLHAAGRTDESLPHLTESARLLAELDGSASAEPEVWKLIDW